MDQPSKLTIQGIIDLAHAHFARTRMWPSLSDTVATIPGETWRKINSALRKGHRGLPGGTTLAVVLRPFRTTNYRLQSPQLSLEEVLDWCDAHHRRTGQWPTHESGRIPEAPRESWENIRCALRDGRRGLPKIGSLAQLLAMYRGAPYDRMHIRGRILTKKQILKWASEHHERTGHWPSVGSGDIPGTDETWSAINNALTQGMRGLPRGSSLARLLRKLPGSRRRLNATPLTREQILKWADAHHARTGKWPTSRSGPVVDAPEETWDGIDSALKISIRGLRPTYYPGSENEMRDSLFKLLHRYRAGLARPRAYSDLVEDDILRWADDYHDRTGKWPTRFSGCIAVAPENSWDAVNAALVSGSRGLPGGSSLAILLAEKRGKRQKLALPPLSHDLILQWVDAHHERTGSWPKRGSGEIPDVPGETWSKLDDAMRGGKRGLPCCSLAELLRDQRAVWPGGTMLLTIEMIRGWAERHYERHGDWPSANSGPVEGVPDDTWKSINAALHKGSRGLEPGSSLARLFGSKRKRAAGGGPVAGQLTLKDVLLWAKAHARRYGVWPDKYAGRIDDAPGENWFGVDEALSKGERGLTQSGSLAALLAGRRLPARLGASSARRNP